MRVYLNNGWKFSESFTDEMIKADYNESMMTDVRVPHTVKELPFHYFDESLYQMVSGYRKTFGVQKDWEGKRILITFDAVGHDAVLFVNGIKAAEHHTGYTAFTTDITEHIRFGEKNVITVRCDSRETLNTPPFGFVIDYMTYGGIYRDVYLDVKEKEYIKDIFIKTKLADKYEEDGIQKVKTSQTISEIALSDFVKDKSGLALKQFIKRTDEAEYRKLSEASLDSLEIIGREDNNAFELSGLSGDVELWDIDNPVRYNIKTELVRNENNTETVLDTNETIIGFRRAVFKTGGFFLNGKKIKIRGLNRHQSYPYVGYAMPKSMQEFDADILKNELGLNAVRTSHYPQSHYFIDRCDEIGLLVFTEFPGWQHIGDAEWKNQAVENVREMVTQYRNHPSIVLWGVRINESVDDDEFYTRTNELCRRLDPTRQTGGVRCYKKGSLLEDVFTYNDFSHSGKNKGCERKQDITSDMDKPYLISEYNGHMYPTKPFDWEEHRMEHMKRHANVLNEASKYSEITGTFGWCMFDYNTHKDFGSGDRICYHGVLDMFRNPKLASYIYTMQQDKKDVLVVSSSMDIGEHPGGNRGDVYILSNADSVKMYKNDRFIKEYFMKDSEYEYLNHGPVLIDDYIGDALAEGEPDMGRKQAEEVKELLNEVSKVGLYGMSKRMMAKAGYVSVKYKMSMTEAVSLFNKYIGDWGGESTQFRFEAYKDGNLVKTLNISPMKKLRYDIRASHTDLVDSNSYDVAEVRIRMVDDNGNILPYANDPMMLSTVGPIEVIGPSIISLQGGMGGTYVRTTGKAGDAKLIITPQFGDSKEVKFTVTV